MCSTLSSTFVLKHQNVNRIMTFKFKDDPELGAVVSSIKPFCKLWKDMPVPTYDYIVGDFKNPMMHGLAGHKWSRLCGFTFTSNVNTKTPKF